MKKIKICRHSLDVDTVKLEKKRERNRIAATKCRQRKLEKISTLGKKKHDGENLKQK